MLTPPYLLDAVAPIDDHLARLEAEVEAAAGAARAAALAIALEHARAACSALCQVLLECDAAGVATTPTAAAAAARQLLDVEGWARCPALEELLVAEARFYLDLGPTLDVPHTTTTQKRQSTNG